MSLATVSLPATPTPDGAVALIFAVLVLLKPVLVAYSKTLRKQ